MARATEFLLSDHRSGGFATPAGRGARLWRDWLAVPAVVFSLSRVLLLVVAERAPELLGRPNHVASPSVLPRGDVLAGAWNWTSPWFRFDAKWFVGVAEHGYHWGSHAASNTNFLPAYPGLIRFIQPLTADSAWFAAWLVANVSLFVACVLIWRWACLRWDQMTALRVLLLTVAFPFAFFFSAPYAESVFLLLAVGAFLCAELDRWPIAIALAALSTVTRPVGLALVVGLAVLAWTRGRRREAALCGLSCVPLLAFAAYLAAAFGQPLGFLVNHSGGWVRPHGGLLTMIGSQFHTYLSPFDRVDAAVAMAFLVSGVYVWRRLGPGYGAYVLAGTLLPLAHGLVRMERYATVLFPAMALWARHQNRWMQAGLFAGSLFGLLVATCMFATGYALS